MHVGVSVRSLFLWTFYNFSTEKILFLNLKKLQAKFVKQLHKELNYLKKTETFLLLTIG